MWSHLLVHIVFVVNTVISGTRLHPLSDEFIEAINSNQTLWRAGRNFHQDRPLLYFKRLMGSLKDIGVEYLPLKQYRNIRKRTPKSFNCMQRWPHCPSLYQIRDQGSCGSCWAIAAAAAMTDRYCVRSQGKSHFYFSEDDVISCCANCGAGCDGGLLSSAWMYSFIIGTVSGGTYHSYQGCKPYEIAPCEHDVPGNRPACGHVRAPRCRTVCQGNYDQKYWYDKKKTGQPYKLKTTRDIQMDILHYGPVTTSMKVYADFLHYKSGVYKHISGEYLGEHSIKLLGWGVENKVKYWLAANSWNTDWGENGFFKILRGKYKSAIINYAVAAYF